MEQIGGIGALRQIAFPAFQQFIQPLQAERRLIGADIESVVEAGLRTGVAGGALLVDQNGQGITVAVGGDGYNVLHIAGGLALAPQFLTGTAPEAGTALLHGDFQALAVHIGHGQHILGDGVHNDGGNQSVFVEFQLIDGYHFNSSQSDGNVMLGQKGL